MARKAQQEHELAIKLLHQQSAAMTASMDGMAVLDKRGRYVFLNDAHARLCGYDTAQELVGANLRELCLPSELRRLETEVLPQLWKSGHWRGETVGRRRGGATFPLELSLSRVDDEAGQAASLVCVCRDITERKRAEQEHARLLQLEKAARAEAEATSRAKDEFLAVVSHELRTPMTAVLGWTWLLRSGEVSPQETNRALEVIERNMQLQSRIIEDLLDISSIVTGKLQLSLKPTDLGQVLAAALKSVAAAAAQAGVRLDPRLEPGVIVSGDARRLRQVFWNLLSNAIKFNHPGGLVRATLHVAEDRATTVVEDDGKGLDPALLSDIFELFRQGENPLTREYRGLGLGLAIVKHLVSMHGGSVSANNAATGKGAAFTVLLPLASAPAPSASAKETVRPAAKPRSRFQGALKGVSILAVDDDYDTLAVVAELLRFCGAEVATASSGREALELIRRSQPRLLVCDLAMPGEDGFSLMRKVRAINGGNRIGALALSAHAGDAQRRQALASGFDRFVSKPPDMDVLIAELQQLAKLK